MRPAMWQHATVAGLRNTETPPRVDEELRRNRMPGPILAGINQQVAGKGRLFQRGCAKAPDCRFAVGQVLF